MTAVGSIRVFNVVLTALTERRDMKRIIVLTAACLLGGVTAVFAAGSARTLAVYKTGDHFVKCPAGVHAKTGCVELTGKALTSTHWPELKRFAVVDAASPHIPAGCLTATTTGTLSGKDDVVRFTATGYYCPDTDTAWYRLSFDPADAKRFGLPRHGRIRYIGKNNTETFRASVK